MTPTGRVENCRDCDQAGGVCRIHRLPEIVTDSPEPRDEGEPMTDPLTMTGLAGLPFAAKRVSDTLADWAATGHGPHIDVMDDEGMAFLAAIKALRAALASAAAPRPELDALALHPWTCRGEPTHRQTGPEWRCQKAAADLKVNLDAAWETGYHEGVRRASPAAPRPDLRERLIGLGYYRGDTYYYSNKAKTVWLQSDFAGSAFPVDKERAALLALISDHRCSPAAPRPEGLDAWTLGGAILRCIEAAPSRKAWEDLSINEQAVAILARLSDTGERPDRQPQGAAGRPPKPEVEP